MHAALNEKPVIQSHKRAEFIKRNQPTRECPGQINQLQPVLRQQKPSRNDDEAWHVGPLAPAQPPRNLAASNGANGYPDTLRRHKPKTRPTQSILLLLLAEQGPNKHPSKPFESTPKAKRQQQAAKLVQRCRSRQQQGSLNPRTDDPGPLKQPSQQPRKA